MRIAADGYVVDGSVLGESVTIFRTIAPPQNSGSANQPRDTSAAAAGTAAAANEPPRPSRKVVTAAYGLVVVAAVAASLLNEATDPEAPSVPAGITVLVLLYVLAQAIERLLEPAVRLTVPTEPVKQRDEKVAEALRNPSNEGKAKEAANAQGAVDTQRANVSIVVWAVATVLGMLLSAISGAYILSALGVRGLDDHRWVDVIVTGLAVGAGTKPIHDLITRIDEAKNAAKDPPGTK